MSVGEVAHGLDRGDPDPGGTAASRLAASLVEAGDGSLRCVLLYGSHQLGLAGEHSAVDFVAVVESYGRFYRSLARAGQLPRPPWLMSAAARVLPPNVIAFAPEGAEGPIAKVLVLDGRHFARALGSRPRDHFMMGRMIQDVAVVWAASEEAGERVEGAIDGALSSVLDWSAPYLVGSFDGESLGRRLLEILYRAELRPEAADRFDRIFEAQREHFRRRLTPVLEAEARAGRLEATGKGTYRLAGPPSMGARFGWRLHFVRSKVRATARWAKHVVTFANWLPYVVRKVERHTGERVELTRLERRWPLVFLWPRAIRLLASRRRSERAP